MSPELQQAQYVSVVTFRKDGREVATPVWFVEVDGKLCFYSAKNAGKVKRLRATKRVRVAPCDVRGKVLGAWSDGTGRLVTEPAEIQRMYAAYPRKYGWTYRLIDLVALLAARHSKRDVLELTV